MDEGPPSITSSERVMPREAAKIVVSGRQHDVLRALRDASAAPSHLRRRAAEILAAFDGARRRHRPRGRPGTAPGQAVAPPGRGLGRSDRIGVPRDRGRLAPGDRGDPLRWAPPGAPGEFAPEPITRILAVACEPPKRSGRAITHRAGREPPGEVAKRGIVASIATTRVNRRLREAAPQPHESWNRHNITETDPDRFEE
jgi:hypothetical protein